MYLKIIFFTLLFAFNLLHAATLSLESGAVNIDNSENVATCQNFRQTYSQPPVVYMMMDNSGNNNAIIKLTAVTTTGFCAKVMESIYEDGPHVNVPAYYVAIPVGVYRLPDGTKIEAGIKTISNVVNDDRISNSWTTLTFSHAYGQPPSVITQLQTMNNELSSANPPAGRGTTNNAISIPWVTETVNNITSSSAQIALDKSHFIETGISITQSEKVGYFVIESNKFGSFTATDTGTNPVYYQTFLTGNVFGGYDQTCRTVSINNAFPTSNYLFIASKAINNASYGGWFRKCAETSRQIGLVIDSKRAKGSGKVSGNKWSWAASPDYGLSTRDHPLAPASIAVFSRSFDLSRVVNDANLSVSASVQPSAVIESGSLTMDVNVSNKGPDSAPNTILSLSLPNGMTFQQLTNGAANWSCAQNSTALDCNLTSGALAANTVSMLSLKFSAPAVASTYTVNVSAASDGLDDDGAGTTAQFQVYNLLVDDDKAECPTASFTTISSALTMAHSGDTVRVCKGTYTENVIVNTSDINITSNSGIATDVIVKGSSSNAFTVNKSNVGIKNLSIVQNISNSRAVLADNAANLTLDNLVINYTNGNNEAIKLQNSSTTPILKNLTVTSDQSGIKMDGANGFALTNLNITAGTNSGNYGIYGWNINTASSLSQIKVQSADNAIYIVSGQKTTMLDINATSSTARAIYIPNGTFSLGISAWASNTLTAQLIALQGDSAGAFSVQNTNASSTADTVMKFGNVGSNTFTFTDNNITGNSANSYGVYIDGGGSASIIQRNIIRNAITNQGLRLLNNPTFSSKISNNCFINNLTHNANVSNSGNSQFNGNFWGTTAELAVAPDYTDTAALSYCPLTANPVLIANYRFDECGWNGTTAEVKDNSTNHLDGTAKNGASTFIGEKINNAALLQHANNQYIEVPDNDLLDGTTKFTITGWINPSSLQNYLGILSKRVDYNVENAYDIFVNAGGSFVVDTHDPTLGYDRHEIAGSIHINQWTHFAVVYDGTLKQLKIYLNNVLRGTFTTAESSIINSSAPLRIGSLYAGATDIRTFDGKLDEIKLFNSALNSSQISNIYTNENALNNYDGTARAPTNCIVPPTDCTSFKYEPYHSYNASLTPSYRLQTRIANQRFDDLNVTVACANSGTVPSRKIKNIYAIDASAASCNTTTPKLFTLKSNGAYDINETNRVINIPDINITKAYSNIKLMLETNASEFNCSTDSFSIRPSSYSLTAPTGTINTSPVNLQLSAINAGGGYNGSANLTTALQTANAACKKSSKFLTSSIGTPEPFAATFVSDANTSSVKTTDIGPIYLNVKDTSWTAIDQPADCISDSNTTTENAQGLVGCNIDNNLTLTIVPNHFDVNATLLNSNGGAFTYLSTDLNMSAKLNLKITAQNSEGVTAENYSNGCYAKTSTLTIPHSVIPSPLSTINYFESNTSTTGSTAKANIISIPFGTSIFKDGNSTLAVKINFDRSVSNPVNPFDFNITNANLTDSNSPGVSGTKTPTANATFVYGRAHTYDIKTDQSSTINPVELEVYSSTSTGYVSGMPQNILHWYRNLNHSSAADGNVSRGGFSAGTTDGNINVSAAPLNGLQSIDITSTTHQTVHLDISPWLWYSPSMSYDYTGDCTKHPCFDYQFFGTATGVSTGVNSGTFNGSDFQMSPAKNITNKGVKLFR
jgi:hypothetical protein